MGNEMETDSPEVARFLEQLRALPSAEEPVPCEELLALLNGTPTLAGARSRRTSLLAAAAVAAVVAGTGWAAAAGQLPGPVQDAFADFSEHYLPFELPHHGDGARVDLDVDDPAQPDGTHRDDPVARRDQDPAVAGTTGQPAVGAGTDAGGSTAGDGPRATGGTTPGDDDEAEPDGDEDRGHAVAPADDAEGTPDGPDDSAHDGAVDEADDSTGDGSDDGTDESDESTESGSDGGRGSGDDDDASGSGGED